MQAKIKNVYFVINPASGKKEAVLSTINDSIKDIGINWKVFTTKKAGDAACVAKQAVGKKVDALAVYGGDGTLGEAVGGLINSDIPLVILPGGSANVLAAELGLSASLKEACSVFGGSFDVKKIDLGYFDNTYFTTRISFGFEAVVVEATNRKIKNKVGVLAYLFSAAEALKANKEVVYDLKIDGQKYKAQGLMCFVANAGNIGFANLCLDKHVDINDGLLDVVIIRKADISLLKSKLYKLLRKKIPDKLELVKHWQGKDISLYTNPKQPVQYDGEKLDKVPACIKVVPSAVKVLVPSKK